MYRKKIYSFIVVLLVSKICLAQLWQPIMPVIPTIRQSFHDNINTTQQKLLKNNCKKDSVFIVCNNIDVNLVNTYFLLNKIDEIQYFIETNAIFLDADKYKWLKSLNELLLQFEKEYRYNGFDKLYFSGLIEAYKKAIVLQQQNQSIATVIGESIAEVGAILLTNSAFKDNIGVEEGRLYIIAKLCQQQPENTLKILAKYPNLPNADSLIIDFAHKNPEEVYNYASANSELASRIKNIKEPYVSLIVKFASINQGRFLFPFLDAINNKQLTIDEVLKTVDDDEAYFKLLVATQNIYEVEKQKGKKVLSMPTLTDKLKAKATEIYINTINDLHDEENLQIRFNKIKNLTAIELYYLTVMGEDEMYTSSFISGVYPKIIKELGAIKTDSLFKMVHFAYYRKFIKMCASFNMLEDFLSHMDQPVAESLMKSFCNNLETYMSLEEAVDVADSYASIKDLGIKKIIKTQVNDNALKQTTANNKKGIVVYRLLQQIFNSFDTTSNAEPSKIFNLPDVYQITNKSLKDDKERIYVQQFFYGDKDGKNIFNNFVNIFRTNGWRVINKDNWVEVVSNGITPITIFANKPLDEDKGLDDAAQKALYKYLDSLNIFPSIVIHRGHSYYLKTTIKQITSYAQLVLLGSCGGYHSLSQVLNISPQAQIIASKQIGTGSINARIIEMIFDNLKQGKDLNWITIWKNLETKFANSKELKERFDDYIPPHKNLGALYIMAYYKALDSLN